MNTKGDRLHQGYIKSAMSTTGYANAPTDELSRKCDRLHQGNCEISDTNS
ncbi:MULTISPECIES: hypothetical protein [unclassified Nostoc]|nr:MULTISPECIES: hypothetical protein [unclassified Nostoc]MDZ8120832.1 hypothetical protein [Nostoc sp. CmiVER01]MDZ8222788.1 hypothetical protein [Nostoc sp. ChiVER01]